MRAYSPTIHLNVVVDRWRWHINVGEDIEIIYARKRLEDDRIVLFTFFFLMDDVDSSLQTRRWLMRTYVTSFIDVYVMIIILLCSRPFENIILKK